MHSNTWNYLTLLTKLNSLKKNCFWHLNYVFILNWIVWNKIVYFDINEFGIKYASMVDMA